MDARARWWCLTRKRGRGWGDACVRRLRRRCRRSLAVAEARRRGEIVGFRRQHRTREGELAEMGLWLGCKGKEMERKNLTVWLCGEKVGAVGSL